MPKPNFEEKEIEILRDAVDIAEKKSNQKVVSSPEVKKIISIVENFLRQKKLICYGGTAINNILPVADQFYDKSLEIPDYDFFSMNALNDAKELSDIYFKEGYSDVEAKAGSMLIFNPMGTHSAGKIEKGKERSVIRYHYTTVPTKSKFKRLTYKLWRTKFNPVRYQGSRDEYFNIKHKSQDYHVEE